MINHIQRTFIFGDTWLYYKLYTGPKTADKILSEIINPISNDLIKSGVISKWFFIRYADPKHHLRIRFHCDSSKHLAMLMHTLHDPLKAFVEQDLIWRVQLDTYQRELERYGAHTIELSEEVFYADSLLTTDFIDLIEGDEGEELRWLFGLLSIDHLLNDFMFDQASKMRLLEVLKINFGKEFNMSRPLKKQLDAKYRLHREKINDFMMFTKQSQPDYASVLDLLYRRSKQLKPIVPNILKRLEEKPLEITLTNLMGSYIHMLMNRLFKSNNRKHEMVCYDFLYRYYRSNIARSLAKK